MAVFADKWALGAFLGLVFDDDLTLYKLPASIVVAPHLYEGTPDELFRELGIVVQVLIERIELAYPFTADLAVGAVGIELLEGCVVAAIVHEREGHLITEGTGLSACLDVVDARLAEVVSAAAGDVRGAEH